MANLQGVSTETPRALCGFQVCEMVHEISERLRLRNAPELKGYADNIKRLIYQWRDSDFHFLQGTQVSRMASALQVFDAELQR